MGRFFPHADIADIIANMRPGARDGGYNATFTYPGRRRDRVRQRAARATCPPAPSRCGEPVTAIDLGAREVVDADGAGSASARSSARRRCPRSRGCAASRTTRACSRSNKVLVFNLGFDRKGPRDVHWIYFPDRALSFYRVGFYDNIFDADRMSSTSRSVRRTARRSTSTALRARVLADLARERHRRRTTSSSPHHHVVIDPAYVHITQASLAETARLRDVLARARRALGRPLRRLDLLLDRGQPGRDPGAREGALTSPDARAQVAGIRTITTSVPIVPTRSITLPSECARVTVTAAGVA